MTTPPHIQAIARIIDPDAFEAWDRSKASCMEYGQDEKIARIKADEAFGEEVARAVERATLAFSMSAEICAKEGEADIAAFERRYEDYKLSCDSIGMDRIAARINSLRSAVARIRALASEEG